MSRLSRLLRRGGSDESGMAMLAAVGVSVVVLTISVVAVDLSIHNTSSSGANRNRLQSVHAAEAGLFAVVSAFQGYNLAQMPCSSPVVGTLPTTPTSQYTVTAQFYATYPISGSPMTCPLSAAPAGAVLTSVGTTLPATVPIVKRTMATEIRLVPSLGQFQYAMFGDTKLNLGDRSTINGNVGLDADLYSNADITCDKDSYIQGRMITQQELFIKERCYVATDAWSKLKMELSNDAFVGHDATSSTLSVKVKDDSRVNNNVRAGTTITLENQGYIGGTQTPNSPSPAPTAVAMPQINFSQLAWESAGYTVQTFSDCTSAVAFVKDTVSGDVLARKWAVRITASNCTFKTGAVKEDIVLTNALAIIHDGKFELTKYEFRSGDGATHILHAIVPWSSVNRTGDCAKSELKTEADNLYNGIRVFLYTPCKLTVKHTKQGIGGQLMAKEISVENNFTLDFEPSDVPGSTAVSGFTADFAYIREIANA